MALISEYLAADLSAVASADALAIINNSNSEPLPESDAISTRLPEK